MVTISLVMIGGVFSLAAFSLAITHLANWLELSW